MIIYLEGPDGSGKSTLIEYIEDSLVNSGYKVNATANELVPTHPKREDRMTGKEVYSRLRKMAQDKNVYILDRCVISDYVYRVFDDYNSVTTLSQIITFLKKYAQNILLIYCNNSKAKQYMLERGDDNPIAIEKHKEISKVYNIVMDAIKPVMPYTFLQYDFTKRKAINEIIGKVNYFVYLNNGGKDE